MTETKPYWIGGAKDGRFSCMLVPLKMDFGSEGRMTIEYYVYNDLNRLYNMAINYDISSEDLKTVQRLVANITLHIKKLESWKETALQLSKLHGEANADAERLAIEYTSTLKEICGVWWENPYEVSPALIMHKYRIEKK